MNFRRFICFFMALCLLATTGVVASSRMDVRSGVFVVLCLNGEQQTVEIGPDGAPLAAKHHCPDCTILGAVMPALLRVEMSDAAESRLAVSGEGYAQVAAFVNRPVARGPPFYV